jgi:prepilin signal peptidase PulO-like enzyme (type II secretory pathway)
MTASSLSMLIGFFLFLIGVALGSFGNVVILRLPQNESIGGRSRCPHCKHVLQAWELIPLFSFIILGGRCHHCKKPIAWQYPLVELVSGLLFVLAGIFLSFVIAPSILLGLALWAMLLIAVVDARTQTIPDVLTATLFLAALTLRIVTHSFDVGGAMLAIVFFGLQWLLSRGKWVGSGDVFLAIALGVLLGSWVHLLLALMAAYIVGALFVSVLLGLGTMHRSQHIAFGPFLVLGATLAFFYGDKALVFLMP